MSINRTILSRTPYLAVRLCARKHQLPFVLQTARLVRLNLNLLAAAYAATNLALGVQMALAPQLQQFMFVALAAGAAGLEALVLWEQKPVIRKSFLAAALVIFAAGAVLWALDARGLLCDPRNPIRWQAVWHALTAVAASFLYAYYLSENTG